MGQVKSVLQALEARWLSVVVLSPTWLALLRLPGQL